MNDEMPDDIDAGAPAAAPGDAPDQSVDLPDQSAAGTDASGADPEAATTEAGEAGEAARPSMDGRQLEAIVEALVFASPEPLTPKMLFKLLADEPKEDVQAALDRAGGATTTYPGGLHLAEVAGRLPDHDPAGVARLGAAALPRAQHAEAVGGGARDAVGHRLRQPVTAAEINEIRGVNTSGVLSTLLERHLIKIVGRKNVVGRPFLYGTTKEFLIRFGLKDLADLPKIEDMVQALGFDPPALLMERPVTDEMLPLEEGDLPENSPGAEDE